MTKRTVFGSCPRLIAVLALALCTPACDSDDPSEAALTGEDGGPSNTGGGGASGSSASSGRSGGSGSRAGASGTNAGGGRGGNGGAGASGTGSGGSGGGGNGGSGGGAGDDDAGSLDGGAPGPVAFPLKVSSDKRYVADQNDQPFLLQGDAAWSIILQLTRDEVLDYLEQRRQQGFSTLLVNLIDHNFADDPPNNVFGDGPFTTPDDFSTPNEAYFAHADWVLQQAEAAGFAVLLCPAYLGYGGGYEGWWQVMMQNGEAKMRDWGRYVGERYASFDNIIWCEGGDFSPPDLTLTNAVAEGIEEFDTRHIHIGHWSPETSGATVQGISGWLDVDTTYTYEPVYELSLRDYNRDDGRPHFLLESRYENEADGTPARVRGIAYYAYLTGAVGQIYGSGGIWRFEDDWRDAMDDPGAIGMSHVAALMRSIDWTALVPDQDNEILVGGLGSKGSFEYAVLAASSAGDLAIAYVPTVREVRVDLSKLAGPVRARWYDPTTGAFSTASGSPFSGAGETGFTPPGDNGGGDGDWALVLDTAP